jgi:pantetheine-phosphate adenylyltransferase
MTKAIVPGTFDPITVGHLDVIERACRIFDEVVVAVAASREKNGVGPLFNVQERLELISTATKHFECVTVKSFDNLLVTFAREEGAPVLVKGLRAITDFEHEFQMAALNWKMASSVETLFIMASPENMFLSSSAVKEIARHGGSVTGLVPRNVEEALRDKYGHR